MNVITVPYDSAKNTPAFQGKRLTGCFFFIFPFLFSPPPLSRLVDFPKKEGQHKPNPLSPFHPFAVRVKPTRRAGRTVFRVYLLGI